MTELFGVSLNKDYFCTNYKKEDIMSRLQKLKKLKKIRLKKHIRLFLNPAHFLQSVDVYVLRKASVKVNVSVVLRVNLFLLVN